MRNVNLGKTVEKAIRAGRAVAGSEIRIKGAQEMGKKAEVGASAVVVVGGVGETAVIAESGVAIDMTRVMTMKIVPSCWTDPRKRSADCWRWRLSLLP